MNKFTNDFHTHATHVRLTDAERRRVRIALARATRAAPVPSPFFSAFLTPRTAVAMLVLVVVIGAGGASYAAESALPGTLLYPVKVGVNEPVEGALATTPAAKAAWNAKVATRRLDEATALAARGDLDATTSAALAVNFAAHASELPPGDTRDFSALVTEKSAGLLDAGEGSGSATTTSASGNLVLAIADSGISPVPEAKARVESVAPDEESPAQPPVMMAVMMAPATPTPTPVVAEDDTALATTLSIEAHDALDEATTTAAMLSASGTLTSDLGDRVSALAALVVEAEAERAVGSTTDAIADFTTALQNAADLERALDAAASGEASAATSTPAEDPESNASALDPYPI